jgi:hypothetical protein
MATRFWWCAPAMAISAVFLAGSVEGAALHSAQKSINPANEKLLKLPPAGRAAELARVVGHWCIGTEAFLMGVIASGKGEGNAYWSLRCTDGSAWAIQVDPLGEVTAIDCDSYKDVGAGKECFKTF